MRGKKKKKSQTPSSPLSIFLSNAYPHQTQPKHNMRDFVHALHNKNRKLLVESLKNTNINMLAELRRKIPNIHNRFETNLAEYLNTQIF